MAAQSCWRSYIYWFGLVFHSFKTLKKKALHGASFGRYSLRLLTVQTRVQGSWEHSVEQKSVSSVLWDYLFPWNLGWQTVISGPCTRIFQECSFQLRRKSFKVFFFFFCLVMFLSNFSKIMVYKRRVGHSQNHTALPGYSSSLPSKPSQHSPKPVDTVRELPKSVVFVVIILNVFHFSSGVTELCSVWPLGHSPLSK